MLFGVWNPEFWSKVSNHNWVPSGAYLTVTKSYVAVYCQALPVTQINSFVLMQNYPNPFNPVTNLEFTIYETGIVSLKIYDIAGKEVTTIVNADLKPGTYKYNFNASDLASGTYFYTMASKNFSETKKMVVLK